MNIHNHTKREIGRLLNDLKDAIQAEDTFKVSILITVLENSGLQIIPIQESEYVEVDIPF
jgi:hypothetical protein